MEIYSIDTDRVINGLFITGRITYHYALENLITLIDQLDIQRKIQNESFYKRLELDFQHGCVTPPITIAFIGTPNLENTPSIPEMEQYIVNNITHGFILDGIQRLNTLNRVSKTEGNTLDHNRHLYINIIICDSRDNLLYRMVTLNNGQKPMTARHQIEMLAESLYDFDGYSFKVYTEKDSQDKRFQNAFKKADILNAYIAFLSNSINLDNKKIIEDKLDELVARKIIESKDTETSVNFSLVLEIMERLSTSASLMNWLRNGNNLMGFSVGIKSSYNLIKDLSTETLEELIDNFEIAFRNINVSKIKLGRERRRLSSFYISKIGDFLNMDTDELTLILADQI